MKLTDPRLAGDGPQGLTASLYDFLRRVVTSVNTMHDRVRTGEGTPEGKVTASVGTIYLRTDGSTSTTLYIKTSGTGNTGWTAK